MNRKIRTEIVKIELNEGTYEGTYHEKIIEPTLINFFYGRNGSGKSTLARAIFEKRGLTWKDQNNNIPVMIFDEMYVNEILKNYDKMPGVFTLGEDEKVRAKLDEKKDELKVAKSDEEDLQKKLKETQKKFDDITEDSWNETWNRTRLFCDDLFPKLQYPRKKKNLFRVLMQYEPIKKDVNDLQKVYKVIYNDDAQAQYEPYKTIDHVRFPSSQIIYKPIISRSDTDFAKFVKALGNLDWIREGYDKYLHKSEGKCPFCQRDGMDTASIERLFDEQYEKDIEELKIFIADYEASYKQIIDILKANQRNPYSPNSKLVLSYREEYDTFKEKVGKNLNLLNNKLRNLSLELNEFEDITPNLQCISERIEGINAEIAKHMKLVQNRQNERVQFYDAVCSSMAFNCQDIFINYRKQEAEFNEKKRDIEKKINTASKAISALKIEIEELSQVSTTSTKVMHLINDALRIVGFKGFQFREKINESHLYELVRDNGEIVDKNLSEGERNFISFLYFYYTVTRTTEKDATIHDKIVVLDDPISSLDQQALFYVAVLTREMIDICHHNYELYEGKKENHIKQIFCMTHNPVFFHDISYNMLDDYECVSFFEIMKNGENQTIVDEKTDKEKEIRGIYCNKSPVKNHYDSLWADFCTTTDKNYLMNIACQIIHYHFIRTGGYNPSEFRNRLLNVTETEQPKDGKNVEIYRIADAMIGLLNVGISSFNDGIFFDISAYSLAEMKNAVEIIFSIMNQEQHYEMMMKRFSTECEI